MKAVPEIVGIINVTRDSFSDGGEFIAPTAAIRHGHQLAKDGAHYLELGPASSHPDAAVVSAKEQIERLAPILRQFSSDGFPISIDATDPSVLDFAIESNVAMLNDIRGFPDAALQGRLADCRCSLVVVHSLLELERATSKDATPDEVLSSIDRFFEKRLTELVRAGVSENRLIVDPGMGFFLGRNPYASIAVLKRLPELRARFGRPIFISVSRKSFLRAITGRAVNEIGAATLAAELHAAREGADFLRTHDVAALVDALKLQKTLGSEASSDGRRDF
ncbi:MAG: dihydropteroate synthase [Myxococcota bacterium]